MRVRALPASRLLPPSDRSDRGVAILMTTTILALVIVLISAAYFKQSRSREAHVQADRAKLHARYCSEYAVARYGVPAFMHDSERIDTGQDEDNFYDPSGRDDFIDNVFQADDIGRRYTYSYDQMKMDKVYDQTSSKPYYFISARGKVSWRDERSGDIKTVTHRSAVAVTFNDFSRFMYFSNGEVSPEGAEVRFGANEDWYGRVHINGQAIISLAGRPVFHGLFTQTDETVGNLTEGEYDSVFQGGYRIPFPRIAWPPQDAIDQMKETRTADHTYARDYIDSDGATHPLTTVLRFDERRYRVAQYWSDQFNDDGDTVYVDQGGGQNWKIKTLPTTKGRELIYVEGVCRLQGIVRGRITVLTSDTLFLTGDIITADCILSPCNSLPDFGRVPDNSPNRIGLASEGNIVVASTLANGLGNGAQTPGVTCGIPLTLYPPVVSICQQDRKDIIINAALFAVNCSFESEFWKNTCTGVAWPVGNGAHQEEQCTGNRNQEARLIPCTGAAPTRDMRGKIWLTGSVVQTVRGYVIRNGGNMDWGDNWIGYDSKTYRYDNNYLAGGPPVWFRVTYADGSQDVATEMIVPDYDRWRDNRAKNFIE